MAVVQALMFVGLGWLMGQVGMADDLVFELGLVRIAVLTAFMTLLAFGLTSLGFMLAWKLDSIQGFHAIMNIFLMPMWLLSGAFFPASEGVLGWLVRCNPLSYGVAGLRQLLYIHVPQALPLDTPSLGLCVTVTVVFALVALAAAWFSAGRRVAGDLL